MKSELAPDQRKQKNTPVLMMKMMPQMIIFEMKKLKMMQKIQKVKFSKNLLMQHLKNQLLKILFRLIKIIQVRKAQISRNCPGQVLAELDGNLRNLICKIFGKFMESRTQPVLLNTGY